LKSFGPWMFAQTPLNQLGKKTLVPTLQGTQKELEQRVTQLKELG